MDICFNEEILNNIFNNDELTQELCACISAVIDAELEKSDDEIDFVFVDECTDLLLEIQSGTADCSRLLPILNSESFIENTKRLARGGVIKFARIGLAAAIIFASALTANAAVGSLTGKTIIEHFISESSQPEVKIVQEMQEPESTTEFKHDKPVDEIEAQKEETTTEAYSVVYEPQEKHEKVVYDEPSDKTTTYKHEKTDDVPREQTTEREPSVSGIDVVVVHSVFKTEYYVGEEFNSEGLYVTAGFSDDTRKTVDISECEIIGFDSSEPALCRVYISYHGYMYSLDITVKQQETTQSENEDENE